MRKIILASLFFAAAILPAAEFHGQWPAQLNRPWIGPEYWSNPLQDWRIRNGRLECFVAGGDRNVYLLTRELASAPGELTMRVKLGRLEEDSGPIKEGFVGFRLGVRGLFHEYRDSAVRGFGMNAGISGDGRLFIAHLPESAPRIPGALQNVELRLTARPAGKGYTIRLVAFDTSQAGTGTLSDASGKQLAEVSQNEVAPRWLEGGIALVCSSGKFEEVAPSELKIDETGWVGKAGTARGGTLRFWFRDWIVSGSKVVAHDDRAFGPILFAMHTLNRRVLKLTAQMAPVEATAEKVSLQTNGGAGGQLAHHFHGGNRCARADGDVPYPELG